MYCEELMNQAGYYSDPRMRLFQRQDRLWRAARVINEIGIHCYDLTMDDAARFPRGQGGTFARRSVGRDTTLYRRTGAANELSHWRAGGAAPAQEIQKAAVKTISRFAFGFGYDSLCSSRTRNGTESIGFESRLISNWFFALYNIKL